VAQGDAKRQRPTIKVVPNKTI